MSEPRNYLTISALERQKMGERWLIEGCSGERWRDGFPDVPAGTPHPFPVS